MTGAAETSCPAAQASAVAKPGCPKCPQREECVPDCEENPPPQCEEKRCDKQAPGENP